MNKVLNYREDFDKSLIEFMSISEKSASALECPVCCELFNNAVETFCGHAFCGKLPFHSFFVISFFQQFSTLYSQITKNTA